ncbi:MAG: hypothetical protein C0478_13985 [Planctomyces sp.]|jgi:uncharacterized protein YdeI (YjbR/CyaY-like superfamily)|nr:hypothetical protein [Planctomyces sp.]
MSEHTRDVPENSVTCANAGQWREWLAAHVLATQGVWLVTFKKGFADERLDYDTAVEEALCFGWIDSKPAKLDARRTMLYFSPRKAGTGWSKVNKDRIEKLLSEGRMTSHGQTKIDAAKADGSWDKLNSVDALEIPPDLGTAFDRWPGAADNFAAFPKSTRRGILEWILNAKRPETRAARLEETARLASINERANQWKPRPSD